MLSSPATSGHPARDPFAFGVPLGRAILFEDSELGGELLLAHMAYEGTRRRAAAAEAAGAPPSYPAEERHGFLRVFRRIYGAAGIAGPLLRRGLWQAYGRDHRHDGDWMPIAADLWNWPDTTDPDLVMRGELVFGGVPYTEIRVRSAYPVPLRRAALAFAEAADVLSYVGAGAAGDAGRQDRIMQRLAQDIVIRAWRGTLECVGTAPNGAMRKLTKAELDGPSMSFGGDDIKLGSNVVWLNVGFVLPDPFAAPAAAPAVPVTVVNWPAAAQAAALPGNPTKPDAPMPNETEVHNGQEAPAKGHAQEVGPRGYKNADLILAEKLITRVDKGEFDSDWQAALKNAGFIKGSGTLESRAKRLLRVVKDVRGSAGRTDTPKI